MIIIKAKRDGFRRCGVAHAAKPTEYQDDIFTPEQLAELQAEPMLHIEVIAEPDDDTDPGTDNPEDLDGAEGLGTEPDEDPDADKPEEPTEAEEPEKPAPKTSRKKRSKKADKE